MYKRQVLVGVAAVAAVVGTGGAATPLVALGLASIGAAGLGTIGFGDVYKRQAQVQGYNLFAYCLNNPIMMIDKTGNWPKWVDGVPVSYTHLDVYKRQLIEWLLMLCLVLP